MKTDATQYIKIADAADAYAMSRSTLNYLVEHEMVRSKVEDGELMVSLEDLEQILAD